ncbi:GumC family protein [Pseudopedobacter beijingensis]|uniref:non-specific protein-tyrosine kinase n=1 Tax=Pseudopedobacter beijingensis TaxID=1207056 RepID=A0ABW4IAM7_9SPHI
MSDTPKHFKQEINYGKLFNIILSRWYWVAFTLLIALGGAYTYLWYTPKTYSTSTFLKFEEKQPNLSNSVSLAPLSRSYTNKILSESWTFKSRKVIQEAVNHIDWTVSYFLDGRIRTSNLYPNKPFEVHILKQDSVFYNKPLEIKPQSKSFILSYDGHDQTYNYGQPIQIPGIAFYITSKKTLSQGSTYLIKFNYKSEFYGRMAANLTISEAAKFSNIANVSKTDENAYFAADALNAIIKVYLSQDLNNKSQSAKQIIDFIDTQLDQLSNSVKLSGEKLQSFKQSNNFFDLSSNASAALAEVTKLETASRTADIQLLQLEQLQKQFLKNDQTISLNFNLDGTVDPMLSNLLTQWNNLIQERISLSSTYKENAKPIVDLDNKLHIIKSAAEENIKSSINRIKQLKGFNQSELHKAYATLQTMPSQERQLFGLQRDYNINDKIYSFLSEKKLEAQISKASIMADASSIDAAMPNLNPISPVTTAVWRFAIVLGIISGIGLIFLARMLNPYIYDKETIESISSTPIIGVIRHFPVKVDENNTQILTTLQPKSVFAESVRSVRTNLSFVASEKQSKVIFISSEIAGEGKSFVSINLASSLALIDKKVIIVAADLRRSKVHRTFNIKGKEGLSTYLAHKNSLDDIIHHTKQENMDLIVAGQNPPNPAELMYSPRLLEMVAELRKRYDYILFDTAPIGLVSDALPLIPYCDINLFVIRTGISKLSAAEIPDRISHEHELKNTYIVLNDYRPEVLYSTYYNTKYQDNYAGYYYANHSGNSYGYYMEDGDAKKKWWKFWDK